MKHHPFLPAEAGVARVPFLPWTSPPNCTELLVLRRRCSSHEVEANIHVFVSFTRRPGQTSYGPWCTGGWKSRDGNGGRGEIRTEVRPMSDSTNQTAHSSRHIIMEVISGRLSRAILQDRYESK